MQNSEFSQTKNKFSSVLSRFTHELRNPLSLIKSELLLLSDQHPELTDYKDWDMIFNHFSYIEELINDFSSYGNASQLSLTPTSMTDYLKELIRIVRPTIDYLDIQLHVQIPSDLPVLLLDQKKFRQAFTNLVRNAREAVSVSTGEILITCEKTGERKMCLSISDNGCGLSEEQLANIFTPFVTYKSTGTGLGLPITREIIEALGGTIRVQSTLNHGTTFLIFLENKGA